MALIDVDKNGKDNEAVKRMVRAYKLVPNKFWIGDIVCYTSESKSKAIEKYDNVVWDNAIEVYKLEPNTPVKIISIYKHSDTNPWWYVTETIDTKKSIWFVEDGLIIAKPNYSPRKMNITLERYSTKDDDFTEYDYRDIVIKVNNMEELIELQDKLKNKFGLDNHLETQIITYPNYIYINVNKCYYEGIIHIIYMCDKIGEYEMNQYLYSDHEVNQYIFELSEWKLIENILFYGSKKVVPNYKPRKIDKTINESILNFIPKVPPTLTRNQQLAQYKLGDVVYIRPDAFHYFGDTNDSMVEWLEKYGEIIYVTTAEEVYGSDCSDEDHNMNPYDLLLTLRLEGNNEDDDTYYWLYRCLINPDFFGPSYKPKHMDRSTDIMENSFRNDYHINPEKYQEKFGKITPMMIPIEDIETYYDIKFEDYCNDLYPQLNESPDWASYFSTKGGSKEILTWNNPGAYAFGYYNGKMYLSPESKGHGSMGPEEDRRYIVFDRMKFDYPGRIWTIQKLISFWKYPPKKEFKKLLQDLSEVTKIDFNDPEWQIEIIDKDGKSKNVLLSEYHGSEDVSKEELIRQHVMSPLLKPKKEVPYGYGSKNPSYQPKRAWDMASLTAESTKWMGTSEDRRRMLRKGEYDCICVSYKKDVEMYKYVKELDIILEDVDRILDHEHFVLLTKNAGNLKEFVIYTYTGIDNIQKHMIDGWKPNLENVSHDMNFEEFQQYMERTLIKPAKDMYSPRKIVKESVDDKRYELFQEELAKGRYLYIGTKSVSEVYELYKALKESKSVNMIFTANVIEQWRTGENSGDVFYFGITKDEDVGDFNVTELLGEKAYVTQMPQWFMDFTKDRDIVHRLFKINVAPSYKPRRMDRTLEHLKLNESMEKGKGFAIYCETRQQYERVQKDLTEWGYFDNDIDTIDEDELDNPMLYPIMIMINPEKFDVFFTYAYDPFNDWEEDDSVLSHFNEYTTPNEFYEDREVVQLIKNKGVIIPNYTPRKINKIS